MSVNFNLNGKNVAARPSLLWVVRDELGLTGTKFVLPTNFQQFPVVRSESPAIDIVLVDIANAVAALTGQRVRKLPMTADAIRTA